MAGKFFNLYALPASFYRENSPVMISGGSLLLNCRSEELSVSLNIKNVSESEISSVSLCIKLFDAKGMPIGEDILYSYSLLKLKRDDELGSRKYIPVPEKGVRSFSVYVTQVIFSDYSTWENAEPFEPVGKAAPLNIALEDEETAKEFAARYGNDCRFMPYTDKDLWFCTCGAVNISDEKKCHSCMRKRDGFQAININELSQDAQRRKAREEREAEEKRSEIEKKRGRGRKIFKIAMIILPILLAAALVVATIPPFIARREAYSLAGELLYAKKFEEARSAYAALGSYLDSKEMADKGVSYEKALFVLNCAENNDVQSLKNSGITMEDLDGSEMGIYTKAKDLFIELGDYKDSANYISKIESAFSAYEEEKMQNAYELALTQLEQKKFLSARDAFSELGNYKDAPDMVKESVFQRASVLLDFCRANNVRGIYISLSDSLDKKTLISMPGSVLTALGSDAIYALKMCCYEDGVEFFYEDQPQEGLQPICDAISKEFDALKDYKNSEELSNEARSRGDFTVEFYNYLREGKLRKALDWLNTYDDEIPNRDSYPEWLENYLKYCQTWELYQGDSSLISYSAGAGEVKITSFTPWITIDGDTATMHLEAEDGSFAVELTAALGETGFVLTNDDWSFYYVTINQVDHFIYMRYSNQGAVLTSCEYKKLN